jgi:hypothetical protein
VGTISNSFGRDRLRLKAWNSSGAPRGAAQTGWGGGGRRPYGGQRRSTVPAPIEESNATRKPVWTTSDSEEIGSGKARAAGGWSLEPTPPGGKATAARREPSGAHARRACRRGPGKPSSTAATPQPCCATIVAPAARPASLPAQPRGPRPWCLVLRPAKSSRCLGRCAYVYVSVVILHLLMENAHTPPSGRVQRAPAMSAVPGRCGGRECRPMVRREAEDSQGIGAESARCAFPAGGSPSMHGLKGGLDTPTRRLAAGASVRIYQ